MLRISLLMVSTSHFLRIGTSPAASTTNLWSFPLWNLCGRIPEEIHQDGHNAYEAGRDRAFHALPFISGCNGEISRIVPAINSWRIYAPSVKKTFAAATKPVPSESLSISPEGRLALKMIPMTHGRGAACSNISSSLTTASSIVFRPRAQKYRYPHLSQR